MPRQEHVWGSPCRPYTTGALDASGVAASSGSRPAATAAKSGRRQSLRDVSRRRTIRMSAVSTRLAPFRRNLEFLGRWLRNPRAVGAVVPSSRSLASAMAAQVDLAAPGAVLELGDRKSTRLNSSH